MSTSQSTILNGLDTAKSLVQRVSRAFYGPRQSIVLDQLIRKEAMRDDELASRVGMPTRDLSKITQKLLEDQIVSIHRRSELKEGAPKAQQRSYYYMDYSHATDVIKWRMYKIQETIDVKLRNELSNQGYVCPNCKKSFTPLDASDLFDLERNTLVCDICQFEVESNENEAEVRGNKDKMQRLVEQTRFIRDSLKKMDDVILPKFDIAKWCDLNGPAGGVLAATDTTVEGGYYNVELAGDDDEANMKAKREADANEKRSQNQLPTWIAQSTISGEASTASLQSTSHLTALSLASLNNSNRKPSISQANELAKSTLNADLDNYYANLAVEAANTELPESTIGSPIFSFVKEEDEGYNELEEKVPKIEIQNVLNAVVVDKIQDQSHSLNITTNGTGNSSGKRSREESDSGWEDNESNRDSNNNLELNGGKRIRVGVSGDESNFGTEELDGSIEDKTPAATVASTVVDNEEVEGEEYEDEFEDDEEDGDPNPLIAIGDKMVPFLEVGEELQTAMTPEEYTLYWDVFQRLG